MTEPDSNLAKTLFGAYRRRVLGLLLLHPERSFHVRELARRTAVPAGSLHRELRSLADAGLLLRRQVGNQVHYTANRDCPVFEELAGFFRKTVGMADVLRDALEPLADRVQAAFVFGSVAQGVERADSDIDVMVLGEVSFEQAVQALHPTHERLMREVNVVVMKSDEFRDKVAQGDRFTVRILNGPKIFLLGSRDDLGKPAEDRPSQGDWHE